MPLLLLSQTPAPQSLWQLIQIVLYRLLLPVMALEAAFLTFPATPASSVVLQIVHGFTLLQIRPLRPIVEANNDSYDELPPDESKKKK